MFKKIQSEDNTVILMADDKKNVPSGDDSSKLFAAISYFIGIFALLFFFIKKDDKFVKFHAVQSILLNVLWFVVFIVWGIISMVLAIVTIPIGGFGGMAWICILPMGLVVVVAMLYAAWMAYKGVMWKMPLIGGLSEKYSN